MTVLGAWQAALAAEQQATFGYGLLGPQLTQAAQQDLARSCQQAHDELIIQTAQALRGAGQVPQAPQPDYPQLYPVPNAAAAAALALRLETEAARAWRALYLAAATAGRPSAGIPASLRADAQASLTASAVRAVQWRTITDPARPSEPFPGV